MTGHVVQQSPFPTIQTLGSTPRITGALKNREQSVFQLSITVAKYLTRIGLIEGGLIYFSLWYKEGSSLAQQELHGDQSITQPVVFSVRKWRKTMYSTRCLLSIMFQDYRNTTTHSQGLPSSVKHIHRYASFCLLDDSKSSHLGNKD